ncbi:TetR/AcrR family transcriptional regulator [Actinocrispum sp. NPDC049592]|uniref:TetR/AcrR family transcriptional regulator n=1 Tax=Actinocrispum sp. NPDC049592 TaxID=3154835 RepID=UPI00341A7BA8
MPRPSVEAERKDQILRATCLVIAAQGYVNLRVSDVAQVAGVSGGTVHYYFDSKKELVHAAFEYNFSRSLERRRWILDSPDDPVTRLRYVVESYLPQDAETIEAWKVWAALWAEGIREPQLQDLNERMYGEWRRLVAGIIRDGQATGQLRPGDDVLYANTLIAMIDGMAFQVLLASQNMTVNRMKTTCLAYIDSLRG